MKNNPKKIGKSRRASRGIPNGMEGPEHKSKLRPEPTRMGRGPTKTFQQDGHWIVKIKKTPIFICTCGNKYLKTRPHQMRCLRCMAYQTTSEHR